MDFWTDFDDKFNPGPVLLDDRGNVTFDENGRPKRRISKNILDPLIRVLQLDGVFLSNYDRLTGKLNINNFRHTVNLLRIEEDIKIFSEEQLKIIGRYFTDENESDLRDAFEIFGQGSLYDSTHDFMRMYEHPFTRKFVPYRIHMADGPGIYGRWHAFVRASILLEIEKEIWAKIDRLLAVAYMIHFTVKPLQSYEFPGGDSSENIPPKQKEAWRDENVHILESWRKSVSNMSPDDLDKILGRSYFFQSPFD